MAQPVHPEYALVPEDQAEGVAWAFNGPNQEAVKYPFKFPPLKANEVRIKQKYFGICYTDCHLVNQDWFDVPYPLVPGHEIFGVVVAKGEEVHNFQIGDTVGYGFIRDNCEKCESCYLGYDQLCPNTPDNHLTPVHKFGGFADTFQGPARWAFPIPNSIPPEVCPPLLCAGITVFAPLKRHGGPGKKCCIVGIGGLGHVAIKFSAALGMDTAVVSTTANKKDEALSFGATEFILSTDNEQMLNNSNKFDLVLICAHAGNTEQFTAYVNLCKPNGNVVLVGVPHKDTNLQIPFGSLIFGNRSFIGSLVGSRIENFEMLEFAAKYKIYPTVEVFDFNDFNKAYNHLLQGKPRYRCVIKV